MYNGIDGKVTVSDNTVVQVLEWDFDIKQKVNTSTYLGEDWDTTSKGARGATGSIKVDWDATDTDGQLALKNAVLNGTSVDLKLYYSSTLYHTCSAFLDGFKSTNKGGTTVNGDFTFTVNGAVT